MNATAQATARDRLEQVMGPFPLPTGHREAPPYELGEQVSADDHVRTEIRYAHPDGSQVAGYLLRPNGPAPEGGWPAALALHGTQLELGSRTVVGLGGKAHRDYALRLVADGWAVLAPHYPTMGGYDPGFDGYRSGTMKAITDNVVGLDLLLSLPEVNGSAALAMGHSLGGHNSLYTACFDPRIRAVVTSCGFDSFQDYQSGDLTGWLQQRYMPHLADQDPPAFDFDDVLTVLADRAVHVTAPLHDDNFSWRSVDRLVAATEDARQRAGGRIVVRHPDCAHDFPLELQAEAIAFAREALSG